MANDIKMLKSLLVFITLTVTKVAASSFGHVSELGSERIIYDLGEAENIFEEFMETYNKSYETDEIYKQRLEIFTDNLKQVNERNEKGNEVHGITTSLDLTTEEFENMFTGLPSDIDDSVAVNASELFDFTQEVEDHFDWRKRRVVSPVRDQGGCQSCWSFSAIGCIESQYAIKHKKMYALSQQQLLDCFSRNCSQENKPYLAMQYLEKHGGAMTYRDYPYTGHEGSCKCNVSKVKVNVNKGILLTVGCEHELKKIVRLHGPVSVVMTVPHSLKNFKGGSVFDCKEDDSFENDLNRESKATADADIDDFDHSCQLEDGIRHALLIVGYGAEQGKPYWLIKNSWGKGFGDQGYFKLIRGKNAFYILSYPAIAYVD